MDTAVIVFPVLCLCLCVALYAYLTRNFKYWKRRGVEYAPPFPGVGNMGPVFALRMAFFDRIKQLHMSSRSRFTGIFLLDKPALIVRDLDLMKQIFVKDFSHFVDRDFTPDKSAEPVLAFGLFGLKGVEWRNLRAKITPSFTSGKMKSMSYLVFDCCKNLEAVLARHADARAPLDAKDCMSRYTTDAISTCAFGIEGQALENPEWILRKICVKTASPDLWTSAKTVLLMMTPWLMSLFRIAALPKVIYNTIREVIWQTVRQRESGSAAGRNDFLDGLIEMRRCALADEKDGEAGVTAMDGDVLIAQAFTFLIAGFETSSTTMSLALYEMARRPDVQAKARDEVRTVLAKHDGAMTYDALQEMKYLGQVFYETLRKYPVLPFLDRLCTKDYRVPDSELVIEKGTRLFFSMSAIQNDPDNFADPDRFEPERFSDDGAAAFHKFSFLPFGEGPRNCIGMRFGIMQSKAGLATLLNRYEVEPCSTTPFPPKYSKFNVALSITGGLPLTIRRAP